MYYNAKAKKRVKGAHRTSKKWNSIKWKTKSNQQQSTIWQYFICGWSKFQQTAIQCSSKTKSIQQQSTIWQYYICRWSRFKQALQCSSKTKPRIKINHVNMTFLTLSFFLLNNLPFFFSLFIYFMYIIIKHIVTSNVLLLLFVYFHFHKPCDNILIFIKVSKMIIFQKHVPRVVLKANRKYKFNGHRFHPYQFNSHCCSWF